MMRKLKFDRWDYIADSIVFILMGGWIKILNHKYDWVDPGGWDTGLHANTLWNMTQGSLYNSFLGTSFLAEHCTLLNFLMAPLYAINPHPLFLQQLKVLSFALACFLLFSILKKKMNPALALGGMLAFAMAPANVGMLLFAFNYEPFAIPLIFWMVHSFINNRRKQFVIASFLLCLVKEQMPLVVIMFGVMILLFKKQNKWQWGIWPILVGAGVLIIELGIIIPWARQGLPSVGFYYWHRYAQFGQTPVEIIGYLISHPSVLMTTIFSHENLKWFKELFDIGGWLSLLSPHILLIALPLFIKTLFSSWSQEHVVTGYYYAATFTPFIFLAAFHTTLYVNKKWQVTSQVILIAAMLVHALIYLPVWQAPRYPLGGGPANIYAMHQLIKQIPAQASVISGDFTLPLVANRKDVYQFDSYLWGNCQISRVRFALSQPTDYLILNTAEYTQLLKPDNRKQFIPKITDINFGSSWQLKDTIEDLILFEKFKSQGMPQRLIDRSSEAFIHPSEVMTDGLIVFEDFQMTGVINSSSKVLSMVFYWKKLQDGHGDYRVLLRIKDKDKIVYEKLRTLGSVVYPVSAWHGGEFIKERYNYVIPQLNQGRYILEVRILSQFDKTMQSGGVLEKAMKVSPS